MPYDNRDKRFVNDTESPLMSALIFADAIARRLRDATIKRFADLLAVRLLS